MHLWSQAPLQKTFMIIVHICSCHWWGVCESTLKSSLIKNHIFSRVRIYRSCSDILSQLQYFSHFSWYTFWEKIWMIYISWYTPTSWYTSMVYPHFFMIVLGYTMLVIPDPWRRKDRCWRKSYKTRRPLKANPVGSAMGGSQPGWLHHPKSSIGCSDVFGCSMIYWPEMVNVKR